MKPLEMNNLAPHQKELLEMMDEFLPHDVVEIVVGQNKEGVYWTILASKKTRKVIQVNKGKIYLD